MGVEKSRQRINLQKLATPAQREDPQLMSWLQKQSQLCPQVVTAASEQGMQPAPRKLWDAEPLVAMPGHQTLQDVQCQTATIFELRRVTP